MRVTLQVFERPLGTLLAAISTFGVLGVIFTLEELIKGLRGGCRIAEGSIVSVIPPSSTNDSSQSNDSS